MSHIVDLIKRGDAATIAAIREAVARFWGSALQGSADADDLVSDAIVAILSGDADTITDAARIAYNGNRRDRVGGENVGMDYFSATIHDADGDTITIGDKVADTLADRSEAGRDPLAMLSVLATMAGEKRQRDVVRSHGSSAYVLGGLPNTMRGAANDADILRALEAVGGRHYGYAAKVVAYLADEGKRTNANAVRVAVKRAIDRTEGGKHSSRD